jgi:uncharacterized membrane protein YbhN (UPF0104 family)
MKKALATAAQILVTIGLLFWIFHDPEKRQMMIRTLKTVEFIWLLPGILCVGVMLFVQTERWRILLKVQGIQLGWWRTLWLNMIGAFFNLFLLGSTGGDIVKIFYLMREVPGKKSSAFLSVVVDRVLGILGLVLVAIVLSFWRFDLLYSHPETRHLLGILAMILGSVVTMLIAAFVIERLGWIYLLPKWTPFRVQIIELGKAFFLYAQRRGPILRALIISAVGQLFLFGSFYFASLAFRAHLSLLDIFSVLPVVLTIASMPISLSGLGVREGLLQTMLNSLYGTPEAVAVLISFTGFLMVMFWSLVGGVLYAAYRPSGAKKSAIQDMTQQISEIEKRIERSP